MNKTLRLVVENEVSRQDIGPALSNRTREGLRAFAQANRLAEKAVQIVLPADNPDALDRALLKKYFILRASSKVLTEALRLLKRGDPPHHPVA